MSFSLPGPWWIWALVIICLVILIGNVIGLWKIHASIGV